MKKASYNLNPSRVGTKHSFVWSKTRVTFYSTLNDGTWRLEHDFAPSKYAGRIPQIPLGVHMNLWVYRADKKEGYPPDLRPTEVVIKNFTFVPEATRNRVPPQVMAKVLYRVLGGSLGEILEGKDTRTVVQKQEAVLAATLRDQGVARADFDQSLDALSASPEYLQAVIAAAINLIMAPPAP